MVVKILTHKRDLKKRLSDISKWKIHDSDKKDIKKFLEDYRNGEITGRIGTNPDITLEKALQRLKTSFVFLSKKNQIGQLTKKNIEDIKKFKEAILKDKIKNDKKPYALRGKQEIFSYLVQYLKWKLKPEDFIALSKPLTIKIASKKPEPDFLTLKEVNELYKSCTTNSQRFLIIGLISSGCRAEEFHNIRSSDITLPEKNESFVKIRLRHTFSKTTGRTITLYHIKALEVVRDYLEERKGIEPDEAVLKMSYDTGRKWLRRLGQRVLKKNVHYHLFRSSCATWLANRLNRQQLCVFFGWKFNSPMPDIYISRKGLDMKEIDEKFQATEIEELRRRLEKEEYDSKIKTDDLDKIKQKFSDENIEKHVWKIMGKYQQEQKALKDYVSSKEISFGSSMKQMPDLKTQKKLMEKRETTLKKMKNFQVLQN